MGPPCELGLLGHQLGLEVLLVDHVVSRPPGDCLLLTELQFLCNLLMEFETITDQHHTTLKWYQYPVHPRRACGHSARPDTLKTSAHQIGSGLE